MKIQKDFQASFILQEINFSQIKLCIICEYIKNVNVFYANFLFNHIIIIRQ